MASAISIPQPKKAEPETLLSQLKLYDMILGLSKPMALRAAVLLNIPDIIAEASGSLTLEEIAAQISASTESPPCIEYLFRLMRFLAAQEVFTEIPHQEDFKQCRYGLTGISKLLVKEDLSCGGSMQNCVPLLLGSINRIALPGWLHLHESVLEGSCAFGKAFHGMSVWDYTKNIPEANNIFNEALSCHTRVVMSSVVKIYEEGFNNITSLVDVGGGVGSALSIIVENYKHIRGINFDLPHVVSAAPPIAGVEHVSGDMFEHIPPANAVFLKCVLHDWNDDDCVRVLKKCYKAIPENGKVIIVDALIGERKRDDDGENFLRSVGLAFDMEMMVFSNGGKERSLMEFKQIFSKAGFKSHTIFKLPSLQAIIEISKF
nr:5-O-methylthujaplicatin/4-O-demethylyatein/ pluviatolide O-methyltransferase [Thujopsis dolabrata var. hondae]